LHVLANPARPQGLNGKTPAEAAGIGDIADGNRWEPLIKKAVSADPLTGDESCVSHLVKLTDPSGNQFDVLTDGGPMYN